MSQLQACARRDLSCESFICFLLRITTSIRMAILHKFRLPSKWEANLRLSKPMFERERTWPHLSVQVFAYVNIAAKRSMLPNFKTKSTDNQYRMYIPQEKHKRNFDLTRRLAFTVVNCKVKFKLMFRKEKTSERQVRACARCALRCQPVVWSGFL